MPSESSGASEGSEGQPGEPVASDWSGDLDSTRVYEQLRALAQRQMNAERPGHTLSATALVHEAYMRLSGPRGPRGAEEGEGGKWQNRAHFYAAAAQAMRRILIDHARAKRARGGVARKGSDAFSAEIPDVGALAEREPEEILAVDAAVARLEKEDPEAGAVVRLRFYAGLSVEQAAEAMGISPRSAARLWTFARATLHRMLRDGGEDREG